MRVPQEEMELVREAQEAVRPHKFLIKHSDLSAHGQPVGCRGCTCILAGRRQLHPLRGCRIQLEMAIEGAAKIFDAKRKER